MIGLMRRVFNRREDVVAFEVGRIRQDIVEKLSLVTGILEPQEQTAWLHIHEKIHAHITCPQ